MKSFAGAALLILFLAACSSAGIHGTACKVTLSSFNSLYTGMSYEQAARAIGCDGTIISQVEVAGIMTVMYGWDGKGIVGANMNSMFQRGALISKAQAGLR